MHADAIRQHGEDDDLLMPVVMAVALHVALAVILLLVGWWQPTPERISVAGPPIEAALVVSTADIVAAERTATQAPVPVPPAPEETAPPPQPEPVPAPQDAPEPIQQTPQEQIPEPDAVDQDAAARLALQEEQAREEQEARRRQEQIDLTERQRQEEVEQRRRQREQQLADLRRQRDEAARRTRMEEQRLQQLADAQQAPPSPDPSPEPSQQAGGNNGEDTDLRARYVLAMHQTAQRGWNRSLAPEGTPCKVRFTQIVGGDVIDVQFLACPFDAQGRESVERALRRYPMPYEGFERVFARNVDLTFCYPEEACPR